MSSTNRGVSGTADGAPEVATGVAASTLAVVALAPPVYQPVEEIVVAGDEVVVIVGSGMGYEDCAETKDAEARSSVVGPSRTNRRGSFRLQSSSCRELELG